MGLFTEISTRSLFYAYIKRIITWSSNIKLNDKKTPYDVLMKSKRRKKGKQELYCLTFILNRNDHAGSAIIKYGPPKSSRTSPQDFSTLFLHYAIVSQDRHNTIMCNTFIYKNQFKICI